MDLEDGQTYEMQGSGAKPYEHRARKGVGSNRDGFRVFVPRWSYFTGSSRRKHAPGAPSAGR
jgi:hypothetical protein